MKRLSLLLLIAMLAYVMTGVFFVQPDEQALVRRFGALAGLPRDPGAHWGFPWGLDRVDRIKTREMKRVMVGPDHSGETGVGMARSQYLTGDRNLVNVRAAIHYSIVEPRDYLFATASADALIASAGEAALSETLAGQSVDWALTSGKRDIGVLLVDKLQQRIDRYDIGVAIRSVDVGAVEPPVEVADAFAEVISALRQRERMVNQAHSFANQTLAQAQADAQRLQDEGRSERDRLIRRAQGEADRFGSLLAEYERAPQLTASRLYLETMAAVLPQFRSKLFVDGQSAVDLSIFNEDTP